MTRGQHIIALCREHDIRRTVQRGRGRARVAERWIQHPPLRDEMAYFVALHEIGHIMVGIDGMTRLEREAAAWDWALANALVRPSYPTRQRICACLVRYVARAKAHGWKLPPAQARYWELLTWWEGRGPVRSIHEVDPLGRATLVADDLVVLAGPCKVALRELLSRRVAVEGHHTSCVLFVF